MLGIWGTAQLSVGQRVVFFLLMMTGVGEQPGATAHQVLNFSVIQQNKFLALLNLLWLRFCASVPESILTSTETMAPPSSSIYLTLYSSLRRSNPDNENPEEIPPFPAAKERL